MKRLPPLAPEQDPFSFKRVAKDLCLGALFAIAFWLLLVLFCA